MRLLDLIRESKGGGPASPRFDGAADEAAAAAAEGDAAPPSSSPPVPLSTIYVIAHALSDPEAFAPALRAAAADRVRVGSFFIISSLSRSNEEEETLTFLCSSPPQLQTTAGHLRREPQRPTSADMRPCDARAR